MAGAGLIWESLICADFALDALPGKENCQESAKPVGKFMSVTDPIADMLTRIRNANQRHHEKITLPTSVHKEAIIKVLKQEGYLKDYKVVDKKTLVVFLKYGPKGEKVIHQIVRVSSPGRRIYKNIKELGKVIDGLGTMVISTSKGVMSDKECRKLKLGGEVLLQVW